jgi:hypothetical protein
MPQRLLIVVPESEVTPTSRRISAIAVHGWEDWVRITPGPVRRVAAGQSQDISRTILEIADGFGATDLVVAKEIWCHDKALKERTDLRIDRRSITLIRKDLKPRLESLGLCWRQILSDRLVHYSQRKTDTDQWLRQFEAFGYRWVGEGLLRQFDVISPDELGRAVRFPIQATIGSTLRFAVVLEEDDLGASSYRLGGVLAQEYGDDSVKDLPKALSEFPKTDQIVICEDGLWTGTELKKTLSRLAKGGDLENLANERRFLLRYCAVSDYGILVCRNLLRHLNLNSVDLSFFGEQRVLLLLAKDIRDRALEQMHLAPEDFQAWLGAYVLSLAFQSGQLWSDRQDEAKGICEQIGRQLVDNYVSANEKKWSYEVKQRFALGAGRFGSTIAFHHGTPKVCLPVFWLGGPVKIGAITVDWRPLVYDERRLGKLKLQN